jgi:hypothetical protein
VNPLPCYWLYSKAYMLYQPDSSIWAWGESIPVARYDTMFWEGSKIDTLGPDTCWFYSEDYDPNIYTLKAEIFGPYPPGSQNDPIWYFGGDSLRFWTVKVEVDENLSDRILDVPVAEGDSAEVPVRTVFRVLPDSASMGVSFLRSPMGQDTTKVEFYHYVTRGTDETGVDTLKSMKKFNVHDLETVGSVGDDQWKYVFEWEQKDDE